MKILPLVMGLLLTAATPLLAQDTVFFSGFEGLDDDLVVFEPVELNGADGQVGLWSGPEFLGGQGDILFEGDTVGVLPSPYGGKLLVLDRPIGDPDAPNAEENGDFIGSYFADFSKAIPLLGSEVSFQVGTRRTSGNHNKAYSIIGRDGTGAESFHLRVGTNNNGEERLGYVAGEETVFDLPTVVGEDKAQDLDNTGGFTVDDGPGLGAEIANVLVRLGAEGFVVDFSYPEVNTSGNANAYITSQLPYNGDATEVAQLEFTYEASTANGRNSGYILDEVLVTSFGDITIGDFDSNGVIDVGDYQILRDNFGTGTAFPEGDINFDGQVNLKDFIELKATFGGGGAGEAASVPEPTSSLLLGVGAVLVLLQSVRRRRS